MSFLVPLFQDPETGDVIPGAGYLGAKGLQFTGVGTFDTSKAQIYGDASAGNIVYEVPTGKYHDFIVGSDLMFIVGFANNAQGDQKFSLGKYSTGTTNGAYAGIASTAATALDLNVNTGGSITGRVNNVTKLAVNTNVEIGTAALATSATAGFLNIPTCAGTPTGNPGATTGLAAVVIDSTNDLLYFYRGGWKLPPGAASLSTITAGTLATTLALGTQNITQAASNSTLFTVTGGFLIYDGTTGEYCGYFQSSGNNQFGGTSRGRVNTSTTGLAFNAPADYTFSINGNEKLYVDTNAWHFGSKITSRATIGNVRIQAGVSAAGMLEVSDRISVGGTLGSSVDPGAGGAHFVGSLIIGTAANATTATGPFIYEASCAGTPTGVPTAFTGRVPTVIDTTAGKLWAYYGGAWHYVTFT